jgi:hypothetical protein
MAAAPLINPVNFTQARGKFVAQGNLLENQAGNTNGFWQFINSTFPLSVTVEGTFALTWQVKVSNAVTKPDDSLIDMPPIGGTFTAPDTVTIAAPFRWAKVVVTGYTSGSIRNASVSSG